MTKAAERERHNYNDVGQLDAEFCKRPGTISLDHRIRLDYAHNKMRMDIAMSATQTAPRPRIGSPGKHATNLTLSNDVLEAAKALDINISQVCDAYLREFVRRELIFCDVTDATGLEYPRKPNLSIYDLSSMISTYVPSRTKIVIPGTEK